MRIPPLPLTNEHGSWAVMAVPLVIGTAAAESVGWNHLVLVIAAVAAFLAYVPFQIVMGREYGRRMEPEREASADWWARVLAVVVAGAVAWLVIDGAWAVAAWGLVAIGAFAAHDRMRRLQGKSIWGDLVASTGLSVGAPAALMVEGPSEWRHAVILWSLVALFFGCSVVYVHMKMRAVATKLASPSMPERLRFGWLTLAYHAAAIALVAAIVQSGFTGRLALAAYVPMAVHAVVGTLRSTGRVRFKRLGFLLLGHSIVFALLMSAAWRNDA